MTWPRAARIALVMVVVLLAVSVQLQVWLGPTEGVVGPLWIHSVLAAVMTAPLVAAARWAFPVLALVLVATGVQYELGGGLPQGWAAVVIAMYAVAAHSTLRWAVAGAALVAVSLAIADIPRLMQRKPLEEVLPGWFFLAALWGLGRWVRQRTAQTAELVQRTETLERDREDAARAAVAYERARIARELHDLVAHSLAVIVLQSQAAQRVLDADPDASRASLRSMEELGRQGMAELRRLLHILLVENAAAPREPAPSLDHLDALLERVRAAGLPVEVTVDGPTQKLAPGLDLSAYRIVQEALTNTLKHAGASARATVGLRFAPGEPRSRSSTTATARAAPTAPATA